MDIEIRDDIPYELPQPAPQRQNYRHPFSTVDVGQSFLMRSKNVNTAKTRTYIESKKHSKIFRCKPEGESTYRVWRLE